MVEHGDMRFLIDWDEDSFFEKEADATDPVNLITFPLFSALLPGWMLAASRVIVDANGVFATIYDRVFVPDDYDEALDPGQYGAFYWEVEFPVGETVIFVVFGTEQPTSGALEGQNVGIGWPVEVGEEYTYVLRQRMKSDPTNVETRIEIFQASNDASAGDFVVPSYTPAGDEDRWTIHALNWTVAAGRETAGIQYRVNNTSAAPVTIQLAGLMLLDGDESLNASKYNTGSPARFHKEITNRTQSAQWRSGFSDVKFAGMAGEGVMNLIAMNEDEVYSPENAASPLHDYIQPNKRLLAEMWDGINERWRRMWIGFIQGYEPVPFARGDRTCTIWGAQGISRMMNTPIREVTLTSGRADDILEAVIANTGWTAPDTLPYGRIGMSYLGVDSYVVSLADIAETIETGDVEFEGLDNALADRPALQSVLSRVVEHEQGYLWVTRSGKLAFYNQSYFDDAVLAKAIAADHEMHISSSYRYGNHIVNHAVVRYSDELEEQLTVEGLNRNSFITNRDFYSVDFSAELFTREEQALGYTERVLDERSLPVGEMNSAVFPPRRDDDAISYRLDLGLGSVVDITESHTHMNASTHLVLGENVRYREHETEFIYTLRNIELIRWYVVDDVNCLEIAEDTVFSARKIKNETCIVNDGLLVVG